jgi:putative addiction module component (TIGR02574 family)
MTAEAKKVLDEALALPPDERPDVAVTLLESLDEVDDEAAEQAWSEEIRRRIQEVESGAVQTIPWSEARRRLLTLRDARKRA